MRLREEMGPRRCPNLPESTLLETVIDLLEIRAFGYVVRLDDSTT